MTRGHTYPRQPRFGPLVIAPVKFGFDRFPLNRIALLLCDRLFASSAAVAARDRQSLAVRKRHNRASSLRVEHQNHSKAVPRSRTTARLLTRSVSVHRQLLCFSTLNRLKEPAIWLLCSPPI